MDMKSNKELFARYNELLPTINHAVSVYMDSGQGDPHQAFADELGITRNEAKSMFYIFLYKDDCWFARNFRKAGYKEQAYLKLMDMHGPDIDITMDMVDNMATEKELMIDNQKNG